MQLLPAIERAAAARFATIGLDQVAAAPLTSDEPRQHGDLTLVATRGDEIAGFLLARRQDDAVFVRELDVHPDDAGNRLGARLLDAAGDWAARHGARWLTLTTFAEVPWNAPYYARLGFEIFSPGSDAPDLAARLAAEEPVLSGYGRRVAMRRTAAQPLR
ncbi:MAG: GNAT family N-acetyltransferase [Alphaproteobacteria bacterium]|nr:GNAT family N-acetyltransferase [Alphaproteobacteria bacterium]